MVCIDTWFNSPASSAMVTGIFVLVYMILMSYSPYLPPAFIFSIIAATLVYMVKGGNVLCGQSQIQSQSQSQGQIQIQG